MTTIVLGRGQEGRMMPRADVTALRRLALPEFTMVVSDARIVIMSHIRIWNAIPVCTDGACDNGH